MTYRAPLADIGSVFGDAVIIACDAAGTDIGALADPRIANIGEMIGFRPGLNRRLFHFDKVPDVDVLAEVGAGTQPSERTDTRAPTDMRALEMRE